MDLGNYLLEKRAEINSAIEEYLDRYTISKRMLEPMKYSLTAGGKRLRPILCLAACEAVGGQTSNAVPVACALEMIHTYSLVHDDLPALDDDDMRRGTQTCHKRFGEAVAVLTGDALLNTAFELLADWSLENNMQTLPLEARVKVIQTVSRASGCRGMIEGQARDLEFEGHPLTLKDLEELHRLKTGEMISASVVTGALIGNGNKAQIERLKNYSKNIGLAFQVVDDILNVIGDPQILGKAVGTDSARQKNTYPALLGLQDAKRKATDLVERALENLKGFDEKADPLRAIALYIIERNH